MKLLHSLARRIWNSRAVLFWRDPPDLIEREWAVEFIITVYTDYSARITATKLSGPSKEEIQGLANAGIAALLTWARQQGVPLQLVGKAEPKTPAGPVMRGVRPP